MVQMRGIRSEATFVGAVKDRLRSVRLSLVISLASLIALVVLLIGQAA